MAEKHLIVPSPGGSPCVAPCNTPYYQEELAKYGGAAVMRMMLGSQKVGLNPLPTQAVLFNDAKSRNLTTEPSDIWHLDPRGVQDSLIALKPASFGAFTFTNYNFPNTSVGRGEANQKIIDTINQYEVAPAVLAQGGYQWVAVVGYKTENSQVQSMFLNDPSPPINDGTGNGADFLVSASQWDSYFTPVSLGTFWKDKFAMVCDPVPPTAALASSREEPRADGREIISPRQAVEFSRAALKDRGTLSRPLFKRAVGEGKPAEPQLVQVLDREDQFYYLIRYQVGEEDAAVVALDARFGVFLEAIAYHKPLRFFRLTPSEVPRLLTKGLTVEERVEDVRDRVIDRLLQHVDVKQPGAVPGWEMPRLREMLEGELARLRQPGERWDIRPQEINVHPLMVWRPCPESISMLYPFYQVDTPKQRLHVRVADGKVFKELTPFLWERLGG